MTATLEVSATGRPPAGARWTRRRTAVRGRVVLAPMPGAPMNPRRPENRLPGHNAPHIANRAAVAAWVTARHLDRDVVVYEHTGEWFVRVLDGWGHLVEDRTPWPYDHAGARAEARDAWAELRTLADIDPELWERA